MRAVFLLLLLPALLGGLTVLAVDETGAPLAGVAVSTGSTARFTDTTGHATFSNLSPDTPLVFTRVDRVPHTCSVAEAMAAPVVLRRNPLPVTGMRVSASPAARVLEVPMNETRPLATLLIAMPEVQSTAAPLPGREQTVSLQGGTARHVRVELDGVVLNRSGQAFDLSGIPASRIERVEVITGPVPGAAGMDGVICLHSRAPRGNSLSARYAAGSLNLRGGGVLADFADDRLALSLSGSRELADNNFRYTDPFSGKNKRRDNNDTREDVVTLGLDSGMLRAAANLRRFGRGLPGPINQVSLYDAARLNGEVNNLRLTLTRGRLAARLFAEDERTVYDNTASSLPVYRAYGVTRTTLRQATVEGAATLLGCDVQASADLRHETFTYTDSLNATASLERQTLVNTGAECSLERRWSASAFETRLKLTGRGDLPHRKRGGSPASCGTARAEAVFTGNYLLQPQLTLAAGNSYTLPSFYDLYWRGNSQAMGNPSLNPERSRGGEARLAVGPGAWSLAAGASWRWYSHLIHWKRSTHGWKPVNLDAAEKRVFRLEGSWSPWAPLTLRADWQRVFAWDRSLDADGSHADHWGKFIDTPTSQTMLTAEANIGVWRLAVSWNRTGRRWVTADNLWGAMPAYELLSAEAGWSMHWRGLTWQLSAGVDNLLDADYEMYSAEPMPGLGWRVGMGVKYAR